MMKKIIFIFGLGFLTSAPLMALGSLAAVLEPLKIADSFEEVPPQPFQPLFVAEAIFEEKEDVPPPVLPEVVVDHEALARALEDLLAEYYGVEKALKVHVLSGWDVLYLNTDLWKVQIQEAPKTLTSRMLLTIGLKTSTTLLAPFRISIACECWQEAFFPKERLAHSRNISGSDFELRLINILSYPQPIVPISTDLDGFQLKSTLAINKPLFWGDIERRPDIPKGKKVNAILQDGALKITLKCEVLTPGRIGEFVSLRNIQTRKEFQGKVLDPDTVAVYYGS